MRQKILGWPYQHSTDTDNEQKRLKTAGKKVVDQRLGAHNTQKLVEIHNRGGGEEELEI